MKKGNLYAFLAFLFFALIGGMLSCAQTESLYSSIKRSTLTVIPTFEKNPEEYKTDLQSKLGKIKEANIAIFPFIPLPEPYPANLKPNHFVFTQEIYTEDPETSIDDLTNNGCFIPEKLGILTTLDKAFPLTLRDLGMKAISHSGNISEEEQKPFLTIQPGILDYRYCDRAIVTVAYHYIGPNGNKENEEVTTTYRRPDFKLLAQKPFHHSLNAKDNFQNLRYALAFAFYKNNLEFVKIINGKFQ